MKVALAFVPPGGGETDYWLEFDLPEIPRAGDYIFIQNEGELGSCDFRVRRVHWLLDRGKDRELGKLDRITVECEFAEAAYSSESHKRCVAMYEARGKGKIEMDVSVY